jgi:hypothetical protein
VAAARKSSMSWEGLQGWGVFIAMGRGVWIPWS